MYIYITMKTKLQDLAVLFGLISFITAALLIISLGGSYENMFWTLFIIFFSIYMTINVLESSIEETDNSKNKKVRF